MHPIEFTLYLRSPRRQDSLSYKSVDHFALRQTKIERIIEITQGKRRRKEV